MKGYKAHFWKQVTGEDGKYLWTITREVTYHCNNKKIARKKADEELKQDEWIYKIECLGTVRKIVETRWEYTPLRRERYDPEF